MDKPLKKRARKVTVKKEASKSPRAVSKTVQKLVLTKKRNVTKAKRPVEDTVVTLKPILKKKPSTVKRSVKVSREASQSESAKSRFASDESVKLVTGTVSQRLKEKVIIYQAWYESNSDRLVRPVAATFAYVFIFFGILSTFIIASGLPLNKIPFLASLACALDNCELPSSDMAGSTSSLGAALLTPKVAFVSGVNLINGIDAELDVEVYSATEHSLSYTARSTGQTNVIFADRKKGENIFVYRLPTTTLAPDDYSLSLLATTENLKSEFKGPTFTIPGSPAKVEVELSSSSSALAPDKPLAKADEELVMTGLLLSDGTSTDQYSTSSTVDLSASETVESSLEDQVNIAKSVSAMEDPLTVSIKSGVRLGQSQIVINSVFDYSRYELFLRPLNSTQAIFLGTATEASKDWFFWFEGQEFPAGNYTLLVVAYDGEEVKEQVEIEFSNEIDVNNLNESNEYQAELAKAKSLLAGSSSSTFALNPILAIRFATDTSSFAKSILDREAEAVNRLLQAYASAWQTDNEHLMALSDKAMADKTKELLIAYSLESGFVEPLVNLEQEINSLMSEAKSKAIKVESLKKERTAEESSLDTDGDGLPDFDEYIIYQTDPQMQDTDSDGVTDGAEVALGFNPLSSQPQAVLSFASPQDASYRDGELLNISVLDPLLVYEVNADTPNILAEIKGRGLANSYLTLYIFGETQLIARTKTDDRGEFSYTLDKTLIDGVYEIYVALTDNYGDVFVSSNPYLFTKTAALFSPGKTNSASVFVASSEVFPQASEKTMPVAIAVIALGLILLILRQSLREDRRPSISVGLS